MDFFELLYLRIQVGVFRDALQPEGPVKMKTMGTVEAVFESLNGLELV